MKKKVVLCVFFEKFIFFFYGYRIRKKKMNKTQNARSRVGKKYSEGITLPDGNILDSENKTNPKQ